MHYTSIENIHKVIDSLFLNELREKLDDALAYKNEKTRNEKLIEFQNYIASLNFLDPACGFRQLFNRNIFIFKKIGK